MANLLIKWLNEDVVLSRRVESIDHDFSDGYLTGELLWKFNQQSDFESFLSTGTTEAKIRNFCLLEPTMSRIGAHYNSRVVEDVMNCKPGAMKTLLYEVRTACDSMTKLINSKNMATQPKILRVIQPSRQVYDNSVSVTFDNAIRAMSENPNDILMAKATSRFHDRKKSFGLSVTKSHSGLMQGLHDERMRHKEMENSRRQNERDFQDAREQKNYEQWQKNQSTAHDRRQVERKVITHHKTLEKNFKESAKLDSKISTKTGIDDFERRLKGAIFTDNTSQQQAGDAKNTGSMLKSAVGAPGSGVPELIYLDEEVLLSNLLHSQKTIKEHHEDLLVSQKEHGRRRKKFVRGVESKRILTLQTLQEEEVMSQLLNPSRSELGDDKKRYHVTNHTHLIRDNRGNRDALLHKVRGVDNERVASWAAEQVKRELQWTIQNRVASQLHRDNMYSESMTYADRFYTVAFISDEVERIIDVVDWVISFRSFSLIDQSNVGDDPPGTSTSPTPGTASSSPLPDGATPKSTEEQIEAFDTELATDVLVDDAGPPLVPVVLWRTVVAMYLSIYPIAQALPFPLPTNVYPALPYQLSHQPHCVNSYELLSDIFTGKRVFYLPPSEAEEAELDLQKSTEQQPEVLVVMSAEAEAEVTDNVEVVATTPIVEVKNASLESSLSSYLAEDSCGSLIDALVTDPTLGGDEPADVEIVDIQTKGVPYVPGDGGPEDLKFQEKQRVLRNQHNRVVVTPQWFFNTPIKYLFGEILLDVSCTSDPLPEAPMPAVSTVVNMPLRIALTGMSDVARKTTALMLHHKLGLPVINVDYLILHAMDYYDHLRFSVNVEELEECSLFADFYSKYRKRLTPSVRAKTASSEYRSESQDFAAGQSMRTPARKVESPDFSTLGAGIATPSETVEETVDEEKERLLSLYIGKLLMSGKCLSDEIYITLIVLEVQRIQNSSNISEEDPTPLSSSSSIGYVIQDFPNTKQQALLLFEALSGFDYSKSLPQPVDRASVYAPTVPCERVDYDVSKCGLDVIYYFDVESSNAVLHERLNARIKTTLVPPSAIPLDMVAESVPPKEETVYMNDRMTSIDHLDDMYTPSRPVETLSLASHGNNKAAGAYKDFLSRMRLVNRIVIKGLDTFEDVALQIYRDLRKKLPKEILDLLPEEPKEQKPKEGLGQVLEETEDDLYRQNSVQRQGSSGSRKGSNAFHLIRSMTKDDFKDDDTLPVLTELRLSEEEEPQEPTPEVVTEEMPTEPVVEMPTEPVVEMLQISAMLPKNLADPLARIWEVSEKQSIAVTCGFSGSLRDIRYQMLQRRRCIYDGTYSLITMHDAKQNMVENFRADFNLIPTNMRFDLDCIAEFHLRALELRDQFWNMALQRRVAADEYVTQMSQDSQVLIFIHRTRCEGAALIQAELNRYFATLHILFDYAKSMTGFDYLTQHHNIMEETLEMIYVPASPSLSPVQTEKKAAKKDKGKVTEKPPKSSGKGSDTPQAAYVSTPFRVPINGCNLGESILELPSFTAAVEEDKIPAKKPAKAKGKAAAVEEDSSLNPMELVEKAALDACAMYSPEAFKGNRELFNNDEAMCVVLENAIWFETTKFLKSIDNIKKYVGKQVSWLQFMEREILDKVGDIIAKQQLAEIAAGECVIELIEARIDECEPIAVEWLIAPDAVAICPNRLIIPEIIPPPLPEIELLQDNTINNNQNEVIKDWLNGFTLRGLVLYEDLEDWMSHLCYSSCVAQSSSKSHMYTSDADFTSAYKSMSVPLQWRLNGSSFVNSILERTNVPGSCHYGGELSSSYVSKKLSDFCVMAPERLVLEEEVAEVEQLTNKTEENPAEVPTPSTELVPAEAANEVAL